MPLATSARPSPAGIKLDDGFSTVFAFERAPGIGLWEKTVTPPGLDGGDSIPTSTMHNIQWRTFSARQLQTMTEMTSTVAYDPKIYSTIVSQLLNEEGSLTLYFPDGSYLNFFGYLKMFKPNEMTEGAQPEAEITVVCTNQDPVTGVETAPVLVEVVGT